MSTPTALVQNLWNSFNMLRVKSVVTANLQRAITGELLTADNADGTDKK